MMTRPQGRTRRSRSLFQCAPGAMLAWAVTLLGWAAAFGRQGPYDPEDGLMPATR